MKRILLYASLLIFMLSCSSAEVVQEPVQKPAVKKESDLNQKKSEEKKPENQDELLNLIQKDTNEEENKLDNVEFESIDGAKIDSSKVIKNDVEKPEAKAVKDDINRRENIVTDKNNVSDGNSDKLLEQIQSLKQQIENKDSKINSLSDENQTLKTIKPQQVSVVLQEKISDEDYKMKYDEAYQYLQSKNYEIAITIFESLIVSNSNHSLADNAQYWIGEANFAQRKYKDAVLDFEKVFTFAKSNKNEDAQFKIGLCYYLLKDFDSARVEFTRFISKYPNSRNVSRAENLLNKI